MKLCKFDYDVLNYSTGYAPDTRFNSTSIATIQVELDNLVEGNYPVIIKMPYTVIGVVPGCQKGVRKKSENQSTIFNL